MQDSASAGVKPALDVSRGTSDLDDDGLSPEARAAQARAAAIDDDDEDLQGNPVVGVREIVAVGHDTEGQSCRIAVRTLTQGTVELHFDAQTVDALANNILALRRNMQQAAAKAGKPRGFTLYPVESFAVGEVQGIPGVLLTLNYQRQNEQMFVIADPAFGVQIAEQLIRQCGDASKGRLLDPKTGKPIMSARRPMIEAAG